MAPAGGDSVWISWSCFMLIKLKWFGYCTVKKQWQYVKKFSSNTGTSRTARQTDRVAISISRVSVRYILLAPLTTFVYWSRFCPWSGLYPTFCEKKLSRWLNFVQNVWWLGLVTRNSRLNSGGLVLHPGVSIIFSCSFNTNFVPCQLQRSQ